MGVLLGVAPYFAWQFGWRPEVKVIACTEANDWLPGRSNSSLSQHLREPNVSCAA
jgi:hypothetical protein